jgi:hypothetical protein
MIACPMAHTDHRLMLLIAIDIELPSIPKFKLYCTIDILYSPTRLISFFSFDLELILSL